MCSEGGHGLAPAGDRGRKMLEKLGVIEAIGLCAASEDGTRSDVVLQVADFHGFSCLSRCGKGLRASLYSLPSNGSSRWRRTETPSSAPALKHGTSNP